MKKNLTSLHRSSMPDQISIHFKKPFKIMARRSFKRDEFNKIANEYHTDNSFNVICDSLFLQITDDINKWNEKLIDGK